jgi:hypothetical protein
MLAPTVVAPRRKQVGFVTVLKGGWTAPFPPVTLVGNDAEGEKNLSVNSGLFSEF